MRKSRPFILQLFWNVFIAFDQLLNTLLLGHPDETLSSRLGRSIGCERYFWVGWLRHTVDFLFFFEENHCRNAIMPLEQQNFRELVDYELWSWTKES